MASIRRAPDLNSWQVRFRSPDGRQRSKNFPKRADAERFAATVEADKARGHFVDPALGKTRTADWIRDWEATRLNRRASTRARDDTYLRIHILPHFGSRPIGSIRPVEIKRWATNLEAAGYAPATVRKAYQLLAAALDAAAEEGLIPRSPARGVSLPRIEAREMRYLSADEIQVLAQAIDRRYRCMVLTAAYTGLRAGEIAALQVESLDLLRRSLRVTQTLTEVRGHLSLGPRRRPGQRAAQCPSRRSCAVCWPSTSPATHPAPGKCSRPRRAGRSAGRDSAAASGSQPSPPAWVNPAGSMICATATRPYSSPPGSIRRSSRDDSDTRRSGPPWTPTGTCSTAWTKPLPATWKTPTGALMWSECGRSAPPRWSHSPTDSRNPLSNKGFRRGRYWARTSDLCRVKAALFR
jgi:hypothetical protein